MNIVAVMAVRNEEAYLRPTLRHLVANGIRFAVLDEESTDRSLDIVTSSEFRQNLVSVQTIPYLGQFELKRQLKKKAELIASIDCDWVIHLDADEIMQSHFGDEPLNTAIARLDREGFNAVNFDEFVFLPLDRSFDSYALGFQSILSYYFFEPSPCRLMRAWKKSISAANVDSGGHMLVGDGINLYPHNMVLRHYIFRDQRHAYDKYAGRAFAKPEMDIGWHLNRVDQPIENFRFPPRESLEWLATPSSADFVRSSPRKTHYWQWVFDSAPGSGTHSEAR